MHLRCPEYTMSIKSLLLNAPCFAGTLLCSMCRYRNHRRVAVKIKPCFCVIAGTIAVSSWGAIPVSRNLASATNTANPINPTNPSYFTPQSLILV